MEEIKISYMQDPEKQIDEATKSESNAQPVGYSD